MVESKEKARKGQNERKLFQKEFCGDKTKNNQGDKQEIKARNKGQETKRKHLKKSSTREYKTKKITKKKSDTFCLSKP